MTFNELTKLRKYMGIVLEMTAQKMGVTVQFINITVKKKPEKKSFYVSVVYVSSEKNNLIKIIKWIIKLTKNML